MAGETATTTPQPYQDPLVGQQAGTESSLSNWAGPYVTDMLARGQGLADQPYYAYEGPLTAGSSPLQDQAWGGLASLSIPTDQMGSFSPGSFTDPGVAEKYMNPFVDNVLDPQLQEMQRQAEIRRIQDAGRMTKAGSFGGSRQAILEGELNRGLMDDITQATGTAYRDAYSEGAGQFNTEQRLGLDATNMNQNYGLAALGAQQQAGQQQRAVEGEGIAADMAQFEEERDFPYKGVTFMQSLLQNLPLEAQTNSYIEPSMLNQIVGSSGSLIDFLGTLFGGNQK